MAGKRVSARFYRTAAGGEPVRDWLKSLAQQDRRRIGYDIGVAEDGWPVGMPVCRSLGGGLWEIRSDLARGRIARVVFAVEGADMVLLHGFEKKSQRAPRSELDTASERYRDFKRRLR